MSTPRKVRARRMWLSRTGRTCWPKCMDSHPYAVIVIDERDLPAAVEQMARAFWLRHCRRIRWLRSRPMPGDYREQARAALASLGVKGTP